ncbi:metallophosphoesterase family protein [Cohnella sp. GCM10027633]|uniref:metallophosphoesterase family protein n=1 Tax=unclassified Cohnella TaxID=2636738 RepID=UPI0036288E31
MTRIIMISDIHGCVAELNRLLIALDYSPGKDKLMLLGDYVDRGTNSKGAVDRVMELVRRHGAIALRGNHDQRLVDLARASNAEVRHKFLEHGGIQTLRSYCGGKWAEMTDEALEQAVERIRTDYAHHLDFLASLPLYAEDDRHIYVHAGLNPDYENWRDQSDRDFMYIKDAFIQSRRTYGKVVVFGHTRTKDIHGSPDIWFGEGKIGIDGGCAYGMQLNALVYRDGRYESEKVRAL